MTLRDLFLSRRQLALVAVAVVAAVAVGALLAPWPSRLGEATTGDRALAARVRQVDDGARRLGLAVAVLDRGKLRTAGLGATGTGSPVRPDTPFEIGSVTKTLTAGLFADLVERGVVQPDQRVRDVLPDRDWREGGVGDATLAELAGQRSGLPRLPLTPRTFVAGAATNLLGIDPYGSLDPDDVLAAADRSDLRGEGTYRYSNLGFAVLGQVLAAKVGRPYPELLHDRVLAPLGLRRTVAVPGNAPAGSAVGHDTTGNRVDPWVSTGYAPAGVGVWSTAGDLARYGAAVMGGEVPESAAAKPRYPAGDTGRIGYAWMTTARPAGTFTWHNGAAGGYTAFLGFDRDRHRVVAVLGDTNRPVDAVGLSLLGVGTGTDDAPPPLVPLVVAVAFPLLAGLSLLVAARGGWRRRPAGRPDRVALVGTAGSSLFLFAIAYPIGWSGYPEVAAWLAGCVLLGFGAALAAVRWPNLPAEPTWRRWPRRVRAGLTVLAGIALAIGVAL